MTGSKCTQRQLPGVVYRMGLWAVLYLPASGAACWVAKCCWEQSCPLLWEATPNRALQSDLYRERCTLLDLDRKKLTRAASCAGADLFHFSRAACIQSPEDPM